MIHSSETPIPVGDKLSIRRVDGFYNHNANKATSLRHSPNEDRVTVLAALRKHRHSRKDGAYK